MSESIEVQLHPAPTASVIWLHGLGADGGDFAPVVPMLGLGAQAPVRFVFPHAPVQRVSINNGAPMRAWYDIYGIGAGVPQDEAGIRRSQARIEELVAAERRRGSRQVILAGFSQGGAIALHTALRQAQPLAGVLALSTWLPLAEQVTGELTEAGLRTPVRMLHGSEDEVVPLALAAASRDRLQACGCVLEWSVYPAAHTVTPPQLADIGEWLRARLGL